MYLIYRQIDGYVVSIQEDEPQNVEDGYGTAQSERFSPGDEFEYYIKVYVDEIKDGYVTSYAAIRQSAPAQEILQDLQQKQTQIDELTLMLGDFILGGV